jgi:serine/threonine protein kinase
MIGETVGHYEVEARLGGGGMGVVYRARDKKLGRAVALKFLSAHLVASPKAKERFIAEARAASALDHPAIATIHAIEETKDGELYIVMAFYEGETIAARLARHGAIPVGQSLELALQAAEGLARAHELGIVHRDVKPANLMITPDGRLKVLDFGLAKIEDVRLTDAGTTLGTPAYMSPEQARGSRVDHRTDIWSLGVVLYEMLTGRLPFGGEHREQVLDAVLHADPAPPGRWASIPADLDAAVVRALSRAPTARQPTMASFLDELRAVRASRVFTSGADTLVQPAMVTERGSALRARGTSPTTPSGERRFVSVLACDLAEILSLSDGVDPEELREVLTRCHEIGASAVKDLDGHLAKAEEAGSWPTSAIPSRTRTTRSGPCAPRSRSSARCRRPARREGLAGRRFRREPPCTPGSWSRATRARRAPALSATSPRSRRACSRTRRQALSSSARTPGRWSSASSTSRARASSRCQGSRGR